MGQLSVVRFLVSRRENCGVEINALTTRRQTPLYIAAEVGHAEVIAVLLEHGADPFIRDEDGRSPLWIASFEGNAEVADVLLSNVREKQLGGGTPSPHFVDLATNTLSTPLQAAARNGYAKVCTLLIARGADVRLANVRMNTALHNAAVSGSQEVIRALLRAGANPNAQDNDGHTPLYFAAYHMQDGAVQELLDGNADPSPPGPRGWTPLMAAVQRGCHKAVEALVKANADLEARTEQHAATALYIAAQSGNASAARILLEHNADVNVESNRGHSPVVVAASHGHVEVVKQLLAHGAKVEVVTKSGKSPLHHAALSGHWEVVSVLAKLGDVTHRMVSRCHGSWYRLFVIAFSSRVASEEHVKALTDLLIACPRPQELWSKEALPTFVQNFLQRSPPVGVMVQTAAEQRPVAVPTSSTLLDPAVSAAWLLLAAGQPAEPLLDALDKLQSNYVKQFTDQLSKRCLGTPLALALLRRRWLLGRANSVLWPAKAPSGNGICPFPMSSLASALDEPDSGEDTDMNGDILESPYDRLDADDSLTLQPVDGAVGPSLLHISVAQGGGDSSGGSTGSFGSSSGRGGGGGGGGSTASGTRGKRGAWAVDDPVTPTPEIAADMTPAAVDGSRDGARKRSKVVGESKESSVRGDEEEVVEGMEEEEAVFGRLPGSLSAESPGTDSDGFQSTIPPVLRPSAPGGADSPGKRGYASSGLVWTRGKLPTELRRHKMLVQVMQLSQGPWMTLESMLLNRHMLRFTAMAEEP